MHANTAPARTSKGILALVGLLSVVFFGAGVVKLIPIEFERTGFLHFGYALWFMTLIGLVEIAGALLLLPRRTRVLGALINAAVMVGAVTSHLRAGDGLGMATPALVLLGLLLLVAVLTGPGLRGVAGLRPAKAGA